MYAIPALLRFGDGWKSKKWKVIFCCGRDNFVIAISGDAEDFENEDNDMYVSGVDARIKVWECEMLSTQMM